MCAIASDNEGVTFTLHRHEFALEAIPCYWPFVWRFPYQASMLCATFNNALWHIACQVIWGGVGWGGVGWGGGGVGTFTYQLCIMRNSYLKPFHVTGPSCGESTEAARSTLLLCMMCDSHWRPHHIFNPLRTSHAVERGALCHWNANFDSFCDVLWLFHSLRAQLNLQDICQPLVQLFSLVQCKRFINGLCKIAGTPIGHVNRKSTATDAECSAVLSIPQPVITWGKIIQLEAISMG